MLKKLNRNRLPPLKHHYGTMKLDSVTPKNGFLHDKNTARQYTLFVEIQTSSSNVIILHMAASKLM